MERYTVIKEVGSGTYGSVSRARNKQTGEVVAIKKVKKKCSSWEECINLREVKSLRKMTHPNIVKLKEVIWENDVLYFVFEYMECNLHKLMKGRGSCFSESEVRNWCFQVFQGLAHMHQRGYFHRDLKPDNLLVSKDIIKIADFGLAREIDSRPPFTEYATTRWYGAPEVLLHSRAYGPPVDMWAMGAIMAEFFTLRPLFPGSRGADVIYKICSVIGSPTRSEWTEGLELASAIKYQFPMVAGVNLSSLLGASEDAINLIKSLCSWNPCKRPTTLEALQHPFFQICYYVPPSVRPKAAIARTTPPVGTKGVSEQNCGWSYNMGSLLNSKPTNSFSPAKPQAYIVAGVRRKLEMNNQVIHEDMTIFKPQQKYRPPGLKGPPAGNLGRTRGVADAIEKFANMDVGSGWPMGGWHGQEAIPGREAAYNRNLAG